MQHIEKPFAEWLLEGATRAELLQAVAKETGYKVESLDSIFLKHPTDPRYMVISEKYLNFSALKFIRNKRGAFLYPIGRKYKKVTITKPTYMKQFISPHIRHPYHRRLHKLKGPRVRLPDMRLFVKRYAQEHLGEIWSLAWR